MPSERLEDKPTNQLKTELEKEQVRTETIVKTTTSTAMQLGPTSLDPQHDEEIKRNLAGTTKTYFQGKNFQDLSQMERVNVVLRAMLDKEFFGFNYEKQDGTQKPKTAEETYVEKKGNCVGLVADYLSISETAGLTNFAQVYMIFEDKKTEKAAGHVALFFMDDETKTIAYIDPSLGEFKQLPTTFKRIGQALRDPEFKRYIENFRGKIIAEDASGYVLRALGSIEKRENFDAAYYFNNGVYSVEMKDWDGAIENFTKAADKGIATRFVYSQIAQAYYENGNYEKAIGFYKQALGKRKNIEDYQDLARTYFDKADCDGAIETLQKLLRLNPANTGAKIDLGGAHIEKGLGELDTERYLEAKAQFLLSRDSLFSALREIKRTKGSEIPPLLHDNLEAYFVNQYRTLKSLNEPEEVIQLQKDYEKIKKLGFESEKVNSLF